MNVQLDLFDDVSEIEMIKYEIVQDREAALKRYREMNRKLDGMGNEIFKLHDELERLRELLLK